MAVIRLTKATFTGGEWSESLYDRYDLDSYNTACKRLVNFYPHPHGGASNRQGTKFICETEFSDKKSRLIPFQFNITQGYILEFTNGLIRVVRDGGLVTEILNITNATNQGGLIKITIVGHGWATGNRVTIAGVTGTTEANGTWDITKIDADTFTLDGSTFTNAYVSGGAASWIVNIATPYTEAQVPKIKFEQSADVLYLFHPSHEPRKLTRTSHYDWTLTTLSFGASIEAPTGLTGGSGSDSTVVTTIDEEGNESEPSASTPVSAGQTITWTAVTGASRYKVYLVSNGTNQYVGDTTNASYKFPSPIAKDPDIEAPEAKDPFNGTNNYPALAAFFDQRLIYARTNNKPQTLFGSVVGDYENMNFASPLKDDDAFTFTINSNQVNEIRWLVSLNDLIIGTSGGEYKMSPGGNSDTITPTSVKLSLQSRWGCSDIPALVIGNTVLFVDGSKQRVRDLLYSLEIDGYDGGDRTILAQHIFEGNDILQWTYQPYPEATVWVIANDGNLYGMTYLREHKVWGWHRHTTDGVFESVAVISTLEGKSEVYFVIKRTIDGNEVRYIERLVDREFATLADAYFVDCGLTYSGSPANSFSGLDHLEGKTVKIVGDGIVYDGVISSGSVTIPQQVSKAHIGLPYTSELETLYFVTQGGNGNTRAFRQQLKKVILSLKNTRYLSVGQDEDHIVEVPFRSIEDLDEATQLFTGQKEVLIPAGDDAFSSSVYIKCDEPSPVTVQSIIATVDVGQV